MTMALTVAQKIVISAEFDKHFTNKTPPLTSEQVQKAREEFRAFLETI